MVDNKKKLEWVDFLKGVGAMMVILSHEPIGVTVYNVGYSFIMIPIFFFASGYLTKFDYFNKQGYLYNRVLKLFIIYIVYGLILPFCSISELKKYFYDPLIIIVTIKKSIVLILCGKTFWFVACLIIVMLLFVLFQVLSRGNEKVFIIISTLTAILGWVISETGMFFWSADTALVCQWFYAIGYTIKDSQYFVSDRWLKQKWGCLSACYLV